MINGPKEVKCVDCDTILTTKEGNRLATTVFASDLDPIGPRCVLCYENKRRQDSQNEKAVVVVRPKPI